MPKQLHRNINYLRVSVTDRCNLRCIYCMPKEGLSLLGHNDILRYEEILRVVRAAMPEGITKVRLTGGEPLARKGLAEFISTLTGLKGLTDISLTTNGILLADHAEAIYQAGIRRINISLDSLNPERYRTITRGGSLETVLRGIRKAAEVGFSPIKINIVLMKGTNDDEILDFAKATLRWPYQVRFIEMMPIGRDNTEAVTEYLSNDVALDRIGRMFKLDYLGENGAPENRGPARRYRIEGAKGEIGFISPISHEFCDNCNRLRLTADGHLRACLLSDDEIDLKPELRSGCSDEVLKALIRKAIASKPAGKSTLPGDPSPKKCRRQMSAIGG
ncbi:MAG: GTP 3',8-cyclase MoaA [Deltaproteobacteria bacterium HGW-Deltaproteobacteria-19]|jgi:cyclic pyranopterin phosphate synthase|nr:MAG: GTP 3',8-cyclase MoaA [Deltaproteobacteria bacterium HGW-Deltaproteobacteria-19]